MSNGDDSTHVPEGSGEGETSLGERQVPSRVVSPAFWTALATVVMAVFTGLLWRVNQTANETNIAFGATLVRWGLAQSKLLDPMESYRGSTSSMG